MKILNEIVLILNAFPITMIIISLLAKARYKRIKNETKIQQLIDECDKLISIWNLIIFISLVIIVATIIAYIKTLAVYL